mgnify:FL=1
MMSTVNAVSASINQNLKFRVDQKLTIMMPSFSATLPGSGQ